VRHFFTILIASILIMPVCRADEGINALVEVLADNTDPQLDLDILRGLRDGLKGISSMKMPPRWKDVEARLKKSPVKEVRELAASLAGKFGSTDALNAFRKQVADKSLVVQSRIRALKSLSQSRDPKLFEVARPLLKQPAMRLAALQSLAGVNDPKLPDELIRLYPALSRADEKRSILSTLVSRPSYALKLLSAVAEGTISTRDLTADLVRPLRNFKQPKINEAVRKHWGVLRESPAERKREIARFKKLLANHKPSETDLKQGRVLYNLVCGQCHTLYGVGGKVGPDITGSNRANLDYLLHNILDPNAEIPNDYRTTNIETKDKRSITGVVTRQDTRTVTIVTAAETLTLSKAEITRTENSELSMMPEGLLQAMNEEQIKQLVAYLRSPKQVD
tara:strand:+ start:1193 stop:2371 length:1179 start_codon:yes stop_codon:yes gene_type:complete